MPNGSYSVRLHFVEGFASGPNQRKFDIKLNNNTVQSGFDIYAAAGARYKATTLTFNVNAFENRGILLELISQLAGAEISGIEITQTAAGVANPTVNLS